MVDQCVSLQKHMLSFIRCGLRHTTNTIKHTTASTLTTTMHRNWLIANSILFSFISSVVFVSFQFHDYIVQFIFQMALLFTDIHWSWFERGKIHSVALLRMSTTFCWTPSPCAISQNDFQNPLISTNYLFSSTSSFRSELHNSTWCQPIHFQNIM